MVGYRRGDQNRDAVLAEPSTIARPIAATPTALRAAEPSAAPVTEEFLLAEAARGDQDAFAELYDRTAGIVFGAVRRVLRDPTQSEEVTQEVFVEVWRTAPRFDSERNCARAWMLTMAHRRAVDRVHSGQANRDRLVRLRTVLGAVP